MVQLVRQGTRNDSAVATLRLGQLILMATQSFEPSAAIQPFIITWLQEMIGRAPNEFVTGQVLEYFQKSIKNLESMRQGNHSVKTPPAAEIASTVSSTVESVSIYLLDGQSESFSASTTLSKVLDTMAERYKLTRALDYGVYECPSQVQISLVLYRWLICSPSLQPSCANTA